MKSKTTTTDDQESMTMDVVKRLQLMFKSTTMDVVQKTTTDVQESTTMVVVQKTTTDDLESTTMVVVQKTTTDDPKSTTMDVVQKTTTDDQKNRIDDDGCSPKDYN
ncbi:hypothetical protein RDWZM_007310 [Blomia tropicalis]|uniref:Uncharacterized protein n=1 Tax=Blomia tropicalis TaxID=40697 RepID=A0A9Q0LX55_BLOTA|nr:hypothetical protein RDWZM_007310 [Blomia tropicalis]